MKQIEKGLIQGAILGYIVGITILCIWLILK